MRNKNKKKKEMIARERDIIIYMRCYTTIISRRRCNKKYIISNDVKVQSLKVKLRNVKEKLFINVYVC